MEDERGIGGRKPNPLTWCCVNYNTKCYYVCKTIKEDGSYAPFVIDSDDYDKVKDRSWHCMNNGYVGSHYKTGGVHKTLYMHNLIMNKLTFDGKGATESVDHINGIGTDNRKANLRIVSQSQQNRNTSARVRTTEKLPSDINPISIPRNVWYIPASGSHGDRFAVEIKGVPGIGTLFWRTTASTKKSTQEKLELAKAKRIELFATYEVLRDHERESDLSQILLAEYEHIIMATS